MAIAPPPTDRPDPVPDRTEPVFVFLGSGSRVGMAVFLCASLAALLMVMLMHLGFGSNEQFSFFRSVELVISIGALGLIVSFLGGTSNAVAIFFAFLVITALILPTRDIVRLALVATGSERDLDDYYGSSAVGTNLSGRVPDMAGNVVREVIKELKSEGIDVSLPTRDRLIRTVTSEVSKDRVLTIIDRVKSRGAFELLQSVAASEHQEFIYKYREIDRLDRDIAFLRNEDLVSMAYDDLSTIAITPLGRRVVENNSALDNTFDDSELFSPDIYEGDSLNCANISPDGFEGFESVSLNSFAASLDVALDAAPQFVSWRVLPGEVGRYRVALMPTPEGELVTPSSANDGNAPRIDPVMAVFSYVPESNECSQLGWNDDAGSEDTYGALIETDFAPGSYVIGFRSYDANTTGSGRLTVDRN